VEDDYLVVHWIAQSIVHETGLSRSGWSGRYLVGTQFAQAFDLPPVNIIWAHGLASAVIPIEVLDWIQ
jgi:hypothetical protein